MSHFINKGAYQGCHTVYLSNKRIITYMHVDHKVWRNGQPYRKSWKSMGEFMEAASAIWLSAGISVRAWCSGNVKRTWGKNDFVSCELIAAGIKTVHYSDVAMDDHTVRRWYVRLNKPIKSIANAFNKHGWLTEEMIDVLCDGLYDIGFQSATGQSSYSPTGRTCISVGFQWKGRRVIVSNEHYLDV